MLSARSRTSPQASQRTGPMRRVQPARSSAVGSNQRSTPSKRSPSARRSRAARTSGAALASSVIARRKPASSEGVVSWPGELAKAPMPGTIHPSALRQSLRPRGALVTILVYAFTSLSSPDYPGLAGDFVAADHIPGSGQRYAPVDARRRHAPRSASVTPHPRARGRAAILGRRDVRADRRRCNPRRAHPGARPGPLRRPILGGAAGLARGPR